MSDFTPLRQMRSVSTTITHTFEYYRSRFPSLGRSLLVILGPVIALLVLASALGRVFYPDFYTLGDADALLRAIDGTGGLIVLVTLSSLLSIAAIVLLIAVVYGYLRLDGKMDSEALPTPSQVWPEARQHLASVVFGALLWYVVFIVGIVLVTIPAVFLGLPFGEIGMVLFGVLGLVIAAVWLGVKLCLYFPAIVMDNHNPISAFGRSWALTKGAFWRTLGISFIAAFLVVTVSALVSLPSQFGGEMATLFDMNLTGPLIVFDVVAVVVGHLVYPILYLALGLHYYSQVERHEHEGLEQRIDALDDNDAPSSSTEMRSEHEVSDDASVPASSYADDAPFRDDR